MLFMGEEHGERAPFQFFSDHIDKRIATATRDGRRREFAAFAAFAGEEVPDPQAVDDVRGVEAARARATIPGCARSTQPCCGLGASCRRATWTTSTSTRTLAGCASTRGRFALVCNFAADAAVVPAPGASDVVLATHDARIDGAGGVRLPSLAGALVS